MYERKAFDPTNPFDACCEAIRLAMGEAALTATRSTLYCELSPSDQVEVMVRGMLTATVGLSFLLVGPKFEDELLKVMADMLPEVSGHAKTIIRAGAKTERGR
jgi:hypothetical protein